MATFNVNVYGLTFSEEEIVVGKFVDGRPIYSRTIQINDRSDVLLDTSTSSGIIPYWTIFISNSSIFFSWLSDVSHIIDAKIYIYAPIAYNVGFHHGSALGINNNYIQSQYLFMAPFYEDNTPIYTNNPDRFILDPIYWTLYYLKD